MAKTVIGITGTLGAGKDTAAKYLVEKHGFAFRSGSDLLRQELEKLGKPANRENLRQLANEIRRQDRNLLVEDPLFQEMARSDDSRNIVLGYFRTIGGIDKLKKIFPSMKILAVDAPLEIRYARASSRASEKDKVSFEEFAKQDEKEMESVNPDEPNMAACMQKADFKIVNDSDEKSLYAKIEEVLRQI